MARGSGRRHYTKPPQVLSNLHGKVICMELRWKTSEPASALYAAWALIAERPLVDRALSAALEPGARELARALSLAGWDPALLLPHLLVLSADATSDEVALETALNKTVGPSYDRSSVATAARAIAQIKAAFARAKPQAGQELALRADPL